MATGKSDASAIGFSGEFMVPGATEQRIVDDHVERYRWAAKRVSGRHALDIACGSGYGSNLLLHAGAARVVGVDIGADQIAFANDNFVDSRLEFRVGDIRTIELAETFDVITCFETIEHVDDYESALVNLRRLLRQDGQLLISSPNRPVTSPHARSISDPPSNPFHVREFTPEELRRALVMAGFDVDPTMYGQRLQPHIAPRVLASLYRRGRRPQHRKSPAVTPVGSRVPRYFVLVCGSAPASRR